MVSVMLYPCIFFVALFVLCVACLAVFGESIRIIFGCCCNFVV